jgi:CHAT domain-containing protein/tetratricopeptide (TPR) repeat protein
MQTRVLVIIAIQTALMGAVAGLIYLALYPDALDERIRRALARRDPAQALRLAQRLLGWVRVYCGAAAALDFFRRGAHATERRLFPYCSAWLCAAAEAFKQSGDLDRAAALLDATLARGRAIGADSTEAHEKLLINRAGVALARADFADARPLLEESLAVRRRLAGAPAHAPLARMPFLNGPEVGFTLSNLALVYSALGDFPAAVRATEEALCVYALFVDRSLVQIGQGLVNLGSFHLEMDDLDRGGAVLRQAVRYTHAAFPHQAHRHPVYATALLNLALWHERRREFPEALRLLRQCVDSRAETAGPNRRGYILALNNLAAVLCTAGDHNAARPLAERALADRAVCGDDHPLLINLLGTRAWIDVVDGRPRDALDRYRAAVAIERRILARIFSVASDVQRLSYLVKIRKLLFYFLSLVRTHLRDDRAAVADAFDLVLRRKALAAEATAAQRDAVLGGRYPHLADRLRALSALRQQIAAKTLAGPGEEGPDTHRRWLEDWQRRQEALEVELARSIPEIGLDQRLRAADRAAVAACLPAGSALVEFVRFDLFDFRAVEARGDQRWKPARYAAFVLRADDVSDVRMIDLGEAEAIDSHIREYRSALLGTAEDGSRGMVVFDDEPTPAVPAGPGGALREVLFDPLREALGGTAHLILAPDGALATLPFEVLPGSDGKPLIESYRFTYLAVGRDILRTGARQGGGAAPIVVAGPDFDLGTTSVPTDEPSVGLSRDFNRAELRFPPLPGTVAEGCAVAAALGVAPALGPEAVETRLKRCRAPHILHLATHGFFLPDQPDHPDGVGDRGGRLRRAPENPLLRCGLVLAGVNTWLAGGTPPAEAEDGVLTAEDVTGLDLFDTELVVLSACETGLGAVRAGEGVFGLRRAFQLAGARTVVMSLWKVPDEATRELMVHFYRHLSAGQARGEALRQAQLELKARYPDPRYWGAFILQGEAGPLQYRDHRS